METLKKHIKDLKTIDTQRKKWLGLSAVVVFVVVFIAADWVYIQNHKISWSLGAIGLAVAVTWWIWTMRTIGHLIHIRVEETEILDEIITEIKEITDDVKNLNK